MFGFVFFIISFCLVLFSSYFLSTLIKSRRLENSAIYFILILVAQVVLSFDFLSIIHSVNSDGILVINFLVFISSFKLWESKNKPHFDFQEFFVVKNKIIQAFKEDRILLILLGFFVLSLLANLFLAIVVPNNSPDSLQYHLSRIGMWIQNQTFAHFETPDVRQNIYSINSEILILWSMIFLKRDIFAALVQYWAYLGCIFMAFTYLRYFKFSIKRILWTIFILASLPAFIVEASSTQTNILVAFFLFCSFYLFVYGIRENSTKALIFSAIAFSINLGLKYSVFFFIPVFGVIYLLIAIRERKKGFYKPVLTFMAAGIPSFLMLASYNHILNFLEFGNFFGSQPYIDRLSAPYGIKSTLANLIRYFLLFFDFSGMKFLDSITPLYLNIKDFLFGIFGLDSRDGLVFTDIKMINTSIHESYTQFGLLGFSLLLPLIFKNSFTRLKSTVRDKVYYLSISGLITIGFIIAMAALMGFCLWNNRFLLTPVILSSVIFAFTYTKRVSVLKVIITLVVIFNFIAASFFNDSRPVFGITKMLSELGYTTFRTQARLLHEDYFPEKYNLPYTMVKNLGLIAPDNAKIGLILTDADLIYPFFEENPTWKIHQIRYENLVKKRNYNDYDYLVISDLIQKCEIVDYKDIKINYYIKEGGMVASFDGSRPITLYIDKKGKVITSGKPVMQYNVVNLSEIPDNFKMVKNFTTIQEPNKIDTTFDTKRTFIYKRMY